MNVSVGVSERTHPLTRKRQLEDDLGVEQTDFVRDFHHELSGLFIRKYVDMLDVPSMSSITS